MDSRPRSGRGQALRGNGSRVVEWSIEDDKMTEEKIAAVAQLKSTFQRA